MPFFEIDLFDPSDDKVQKIALEASSPIEAYEIALIKVTATSFEVPAPTEFKEVDFRRALLISRGKSGTEELKAKEFKPEARERRT